MHTQSVLLRNDRHLDDDFSTHWDQISDALQAVILRGRAIGDSEYAASLEMVGGAEKFFTSFFYDYDAIVAPSAAGEAPLKCAGTGDPVFCTVWTVAGLPTINLPLLSGRNDLPIGVQLIGSSERDDRLMTTAKWMISELGASEA